MLLFFLSFDKKYLEILANSDGDICLRYLFLMKTWYFGMVSSKTICIWHTHTEYSISAGNVEKRKQKGLPLISSEPESPSLPNLLLH